jgi:hypothetical protein
VPTAIEFRLTCDRPIDPDTRQLHGLTCAIFEGDGSAGHLSQDKPFTVWPLRPAPADPGQAWMFRAGWLPHGSPPERIMSLSEVRIGHATCAITETTGRTISHAQLAAGPRSGIAQVTFHSPVYFTQNGTDTVLPDPRLILGSWRRSWNSSLPDSHELRISDDAWRDVHRATRLAAFDLRTATMDSGRGYARAGFTGTVTLRLGKEAPAESATRFAALARFAEFCGTGAQATHGFGATTLSSGPLKAD